MSTRTGGNMGSPDAYSDTRCVWTFCTTYVPYRFAREQMPLCRDHALYAWTVVQEQLGRGETIEPEPRAEPEPAEPHEIPPGYVYYVRTGGRIKIGYTRAILWRLAQYPPDLEVLYVQTGDKKLERAEHQRFRAYLAEGREWFQDRPEVSEPILQLAAAAPPNWAKDTIGADSWWRRRQAPAVAVRRHTHQM